MSHDGLGLVFFYLSHRNSELVFFVPRYDLKLAILLHNVMVEYIVLSRLPDNDSVLVFLNHQN